MHTLFVATAAVLLAASSGSGGLAAAVALPEQSLGYAPAALHSQPSDPAPAALPTPSAGPAPAPIPPMDANSTNSPSTPAASNQLSASPTALASSLPLGPPSAWCSYTNKYCDVLGDPLFGGFNYFKIETINWPDDPGSCVLGVLDNVRGQTSGAEGAHWKCDPVTSNVQSMSFWVSTVYLDAGSKVANAIKLASPGGTLQVDCTYHDVQSYPESRSYPKKGAKVCPQK